ncbi:MAG: hypothetical protein PHF46_03940, partial [Candidatus Gracilibacteria bacterium]|nr:hypothetical protein [Candidatus Gracilibacteria bacterium]
DSITSTINDVLPKCAMMKELPNLVERAENEYKKLEKGLAEVKSKPKSGDLDVTEAIKDFETKVTDLGNILADIKANMNKDPEQTIENIQVKFFDQLEQTWQMYGALQALYNLQKASVMIVKAVKTNDNIIEQLKNKKIDTKELEVINEKIKARVEEFIAKIRVKITQDQTDNLMEMIANIMIMKEEFDKLAAGVSGDTSIDMSNANPMDSYTPDFGNFEDIKNNVLEGGIDTKSSPDEYSSDSDKAMAEKLRTQLEKVITVFATKLDNKFGTNKDSKVKFLDEIINKAGKLLDKYKSGKSFVTMKELIAKLKELKSSYEIGFNVDYNDLLEGDIKDLLDVK